MFDVRSLRLEIGDEHRESIDVAVQPFTIGHEPYVADQERVPAELRITRLRSGLLFRLRFAVRLTGPCHRCLEPAVVDLELDVEEYQDDHPEPGAEDDMTCEYLKDGVLDTDRWASDAVVLQMPPKVLCRDDCAGLCPQCGADLNAGPCGCSEPADERWSALRRLL